MNVPNPHQIDHKKAAMRLARKLAVIGSNHKQKSKLISKWEAHCKAFIVVKNGR